MTSGRRVTALWLSLMVVLWGTSWPLSTLALATMPPLWLAAFRFASAAACLFAFTAARGMLHPPRRGDWPIVLTVGLLQMMAFTGLGMLALPAVGAGHAALLAYTTPLWGLLVGWAVLRSAPSRRQWISLAVGLVGVVVVCSPFDPAWRTPATLIGAGMLLVAAVCWSVVILHVRRHRWVSSPLSLAPWQMLLAAIPLGLLAALYEGSPTTIVPSAHLVGELVVIGPIATSACFVISSEYGRRISTFAMSNLTLGVPLVGIAGSIVLLHEEISWSFATGIALVVTSMVFAAIWSTRTDSAPAQETARTPTRAVAFPEPARLTCSTGDERG